MSGPCGRFAHTSSGRLHLGNVFSSLLAWLCAKSRGGKMILRIEDLDSSRCHKELALLMAGDLEWLGLTWDEGAYLENGDAYFQSGRADIYEKYFEKLESLTYHCFCSRAELHAAEAPHMSNRRFVYGGRCRNLTNEERRAKKRPSAWRLRAEGKISFTDGHYGKQESNLQRDNCDFIIRRSDGVFAYQFAVAVDDALIGGGDPDGEGPRPFKLIAAADLHFKAPWAHAALLFPRAAAPYAGRAEAFQN